MELRFGRDFSRVRVHTDAKAVDSARALNASAYTVGHDVAFGARQYLPKTSEGRRLLAHELTHVLQQSAAQERPGGQATPPMVRQSTGALIVQRAPNSSLTLGSIENFFDLNLSELMGPIETAVDVMLGEPLTAEEMNRVLLLRRATPLSIPASQVNTAPQRIAEINRELADLQDRFRRARGFPRDMIKRQVTKLLTEKRRLTKGQALGTFGKGTTAGTGQITYAAIQVVDSQGRRIALEFSETSSLEHAEEIIVRRLVAKFTPDQLRGARIVVVADQRVCEERCQPALRKFAEMFDVESIEAKRFVRQKIDGSGYTSARTTMRTATRASSADLPLKEVTEWIYRKPSGRPSTQSTFKPPAAVPEAHVSPQKMVVPETPSLRTRTTSADVSQPSRPTLGARIRGAAMHAGGTLIFDLLLDLVNAKIREWLDEKKFNERMRALKPYIEIAKVGALQNFMKDPWFAGGSGFYYNIQIRITVTSTTVIGGGHALQMTGFPMPSIENVSISSKIINASGPVDEHARVPGVREGATGGMVMSARSQVLTYSEPVD
jgi:hypothetical protein